MRKNEIIESINRVCHNKREAEAIFLECIKENALENKEEYSKGEVVKLCNSLKRRGGYLAVVASILAAKVYLS